MTWTNPKTWAPNDILTAADLNTYTRDNELALGTWTTYVPLWTATTTNPVIGNGTILGRYMATTDWCEVWVGIKAGSTTTFGSGQYSVSLPIAAASGIWEQFVSIQLNDFGVSRYSGTGVASPGSNALLFYDQDWSSLWGNTVPFTFGNGDAATIYGRYRLT
jgi:hypothetical protein